MKKFPFFSIQLIGRPIPLYDTTSMPCSSVGRALRAADEKIDATLAAMIEVYKAAKAQGFGLCSRVIGELVEGLQEESGERRTKAEYQLGKAGASAEGLM